MTRMKTKYVCSVGLLCVVLSVTTEAATAGCPLQLEQCQKRFMELDQQIGRIGAQVAIMEGRQHAVTEEFKREMTVLSTDVKTHKTVINSLVEDNVQMQGRMRVLQGVDGDVRTLKKRVTDMDSDIGSSLQEVRGQIATVRHSIEQEADAQQKVSVFMSSQMNQNRQTLDGLKRKVTEVEGKTVQLESKVSGMEQEMTSVSGRDVQAGNAEAMAEMMQRLDGLQDKYDSKLRELEQKIKQLSNKLM